MVDMTLTQSAIVVNCYNVAKIIATGLLNWWLLYIKV